MGNIQANNSPSKRRAELTWHFLSMADGRPGLGKMFGNLIDGSKDASWRLEIERGSSQNYENRSNFKRFPMR